MPHSSISEDQIRFFHENGYLILPSALETAELDRLQEATAEIISHGTSRVRENPDYCYAIGHSSGESVLHRVNYVIDKCDECKTLLGNPFILRTTEQLMGKDLIPTWDAVVLKMPGEGIIVPWHRDAAPDLVGDQPIFNVDFYLDAADNDTCVWVVPGSHLWEPDRIESWLADHKSTDITREDFEKSGAVPALMQPGDVMLHNILVLHGSPQNSSANMRRVIYYEFRAAHVEDKLGPHIREYIPLKQKVLRACIHSRKSANYISRDEVPYLYAPPAPYNRTKLTPGTEPKSFRITHEEYWRPAQWSPRLSLDLKSVGGCRVSPDGCSSVFVATSFLLKEELSEQRSRVWLNKTDGGDAKALTSSEVSSGNPRWSPNGDFIAFTSKRGERSALFAMPVDGGEPTRLTDLKSDVGDYRWSPDGEWIAFLATEGPSEADEKRTKEKDDWRWENEELKYSRLSMIPVQEDAGGNRDPITLSPPALHVTGLNWSPDGAEIAFDYMPHPLADYWTKSAISKVNVVTGEVTSLTSGSVAAFGPVYSRDGKEIAFVRSSDPPRWSFDGQIHVMPNTGGEPRPMNPTIERGPAILGWSAADDAILLVEAAGTTTAIYSTNKVTGETTMLYRPDGALIEADLNAAGTHLGLVHQRVDEPGEAYVASVDDLSPRRISSVNTAHASVPVAKTVQIKWNSPDGLEIEGLLTYPIGYTAGTRVPLLLVVHGGPAGVFVQSFIGNPGVYHTAAFAAHGYAVLRCNPRGSSGYGESFRSANRKDWGGGDYRDLMSGVDKVIEMGVADPDRMGVMGWSYGGYMTSWIITQTNRFKAASVGAGVTNLMSFNGTADIPSFIPDYFEAQSWENLELYRDHSAMFQVGSVKTPTLIVHGEADIRVPISQGYEYYNALRQLGVETRMLVLPRQPHGPIEPKLMLKNMEANLEWFRKYV